MPSASRRDVSTGAGASGVLVSDAPNPTRTQTVEERYARVLRGRYQDLNALIREYVGERDVLGLESGSVRAASPPPSFEFSRDDEKIEGFRDWLLEAQREEVLDVVSAGENRYVQQAYETGIRASHADLRQANIANPSLETRAALQLPVHETTLQVLFTRNFSELEGLTQEMGREVARELSQALAEGTGPREAARRITDVLGRVENGTPRGAQARATTIARTETLRARHLGAREELKRHGVERVEPILAPDACEICVAIAADAPYPVDEMGSLLPAHPNCRCSWAIYTGPREATAHHHGHTHGPVIRGAGSG